MSGTTYFQSVGNCWNRRTRSPSYRFPPTLFSMCGKAIDRSIASGPIARLILSESESPKHPNRLRKIRGFRCRVSSNADWDARHVKFRVVAVSTHWAVVAGRVGIFSGCQAELVRNKLGQNCRRLREVSEFLNSEQIEDFCAVIADR